MEGRIIDSVTTLDSKFYGCEDVNTDALFDLFEVMVAFLSLTHIRKAHFELADFRGTKELSIDAFSLLMEREEINGMVCWKGTFKNGGDKLEILGSCD